MSCPVNFLSPAAYMKACIVINSGRCGSMPDFLLLKNRIAAIITYLSREPQDYQWHSIFPHKSVMILIIPWPKAKLEKQEWLLIHCKTWKNYSREFRYRTSRHQ